MVSAGIFVMGYDLYSPVLAVVNFVCFVAFIACCVIVYWAAVIGQVQGNYKQVAIGALVGVGILLGLHFYLSDAFNLPLLVPPVGTPFFTEFMHVIQYIVSVAVLLLGVFIFVVALLKNFDRKYGGSMFSALLFLIILFFLHYYVFETFGIPLIFPPTLW